MSFPNARRKSCPRQRRSKKSISNWRTNWREGKNNPQAPYYAKFVGIANGQIVVVADSLDEADRQLDQIEPDPTRTAIVDVGYDPDRVHYV